MNPVRMIFRAPTGRRDAFVRSLPTGAWEAHENVAEIYVTDDGTLCLEAPDRSLRALYAAGSWKSVQHPELGTATTPRTLWPDDTFGAATIQSS